MSVPVFFRSKEGMPELVVRKGEEAIEGFESAYGEKPDFVTRSPGRVNLIGEHIDYADFSVFPLALAKGVSVVVKVIKGRKFILKNGDPQFLPDEFEVPENGELIKIDPTVRSWTNYFKCGLIVAQKFLKEIKPEKFDEEPVVGMEIYCEGDVPTGSGLSSSGGFICAVALAIVRGNMGKEYHISKKDLTRITVVAEHYVGVSSGGMDQSASVSGKVDHALYVEFKPELKATPYKFPSMKEYEVEFIIANTLLVVNKIETAPTNYNLRVVEAVVSAEALARKYGVKMEHIGPANLGKPNLRDFMNAYYGKYENEKEPWSGDVDMGIEHLKKMIELVENTFGNKKEGYTTEEAAKLLGISVDEFTKEYLTEFPVKYKVLKLYQRSKHIYSEALRVLKALRVMRNDKFEDDEEFFKEFGELMNESQKSCDKLYECSCDEINEICKIARRNGSYGSRLTGAGWGGCTVHLVPGGKNGKVEEVKEALIREYYKKKFPKITDKEIEDAIIITRPSLGSFVYEL